MPRVFLFLRIIQRQVVWSIELNIKTNLEFCQFLSDRKKWSVILKSFLKRNFGVFFWCFPNKAEHFSAYSILFSKTAPFVWQNYHVRHISLLSIRWPSLSFLQENDKTQIMSQAIFDWTNRKSAVFQLEYAFMAMVFLFLRYRWVLCLLIDKSFYIRLASAQLSNKFKTDGFAVIEFECPWSALLNNLHKNIKRSHAYGKNLQAHR